MRPSNARKKGMDNKLAIAIFFLLALFGFVFIINAAPKFALDNANGGISMPTGLVPSGPESETTNAQEEPAPNPNMHVFGEYTTRPSFSIDVAYDFSVYERLRGLARQFMSQVEICKKNKTIAVCVSETLANPVFSDITLDCETPEQKLFYDFIEQYQGCMESSDNDCLCSLSMDFDGYENREYVIEVFNEWMDHQIALKGSSDLLQFFDGVPRIISPEDVFAELDSLQIKITYENDRIKELSFDKFTADKVYLHKMDHEVAFMSSTQFNARAATKQQCTIPRKEIYKFCHKTTEKLIGHKNPIQYNFVLDLS